MKYAYQFVFIGGLIAFSSCSKLDLIEPAGFETNIEADSIVFAQIGDFGSSGTPEQKVADLVKSWNPFFIVSAGDNNYTEGKLSSIKENITHYYGDYIYNYDAPSSYRCNGKAFKDSINRFFPTPGNHDANNRDGLVPYLNYFTLPGNERYYKFSWGPVTFFSINTADENIDKEKAWLEEQIPRVTTPFKIVFCHHPPYSSGGHGNTAFMQWDFHAMGIDVVFAGHDHIYNKIEKKGEDGLYYIVNGLGGREKYGCDVHPLDSGLFSSYCYDTDYGAIKGMANAHRLILEFYAVSNPSIPVDRIEILK